MRPDRAFRKGIDYSSTNPGMWYVWREPGWPIEGEGFFVEHESKRERLGKPILKAYRNGAEIEDRLAQEHDGHKGQWMDGD